MTPAELQKKISDRAKVNAWLDSIQEFDEECRAEVMDQCKTDPEARTFYVSRYEKENAAKGHKVAEPLLIGDSTKAQRVLVNGGTGANMLGITRAEDTMHKKFPP